MDDNFCNPAKLSFSDFMICNAAQIMDGVIGRRFARMNLSFCDKDQFPLQISEETVSVSKSLPRKGKEGKDEGELLPSSKSSNVVCGDPIDMASL